MLHLYINLPRLLMKLQNIGTALEICSTVETSPLEHPGAVWVMVHYITLKVQKPFLLTVQE